VTRRRRRGAPQGLAAAAVSCGPAAAVALAARRLRPGLAVFAAAGVTLVISARAARAAFNLTSLKVT
jgi:hypothetical protein